MATGTVKWFAQALTDICNKVHNIASDDLRVAIVNPTTVPTVATAGPHFGGTGTTNFATNQVAVGTAYIGPVALANKSVVHSATGPTFRADVVTVAQDASGFANGAYAIIYNNTDANKRAIGFAELSAAGSATIVSGPLTLDWSGANNDILSLAAQ